MRITNQMMTNNVMNNINKNKNNLSRLEQQYSSGKKIQRPSEDPIIAVRALKLRSNLSELNQYYEKNIPDAKNWMDVTESALNNINSILTTISESCNQGANDTLTVSDRTSVVQTLQQLKDQIYDEGNTTYAGRYVFTGYKTNTSLSFDKDTTDLDYNITENFTADDLEEITKVVGAYEVDDYVPSGTNDFSTSPTQVTTHRIRLAYDELTTGQTVNFTYTTSGTPTTVACTTVTSTDTGAYTPGANQVYFVQDTGELVFGDTIYQTVTQADSMSVEYEKDSFKDGDLRPEHYFNCDVTDVSGTTTTYVKSDQEIQYQINFNQSITVNTQASDAITPDIGRAIDEILDAVNDVTATETKISEVEKIIADSSTPSGDLDALNQLLEQLNTELTLKSSIMQDKFEKGLAVTNDYQDVVNVAVADLGSRYQRVELTEDRLSSQQVEYTDLLSNNEDADVTQVYIDYSSAETLYNASLSAASKLIQTSLLDFL